MNAVRRLLSPLFWTFLFVMMTSPAGAVTHDEATQIIPEMRLRCQPMTSGGGVVSGATINATLQAYTFATSYGGPAYNPYARSVSQTPTSPGLTAPTGVYLDFAVPLDIYMVLRIQGQGMSSYQLLFNVPDEKYEVFIGPVGAGPAGIPSRRMIDWTVPQSWTANTPIDETYAVRISRKAAAGALGGKCDSLGMDWRHLKIALGDDRSGRSCGYVYLNTEATGAKAYYDYESPEVTVSPDRTSFVSPQVTVLCQYDPVDPNLLNAHLTATVYDNVSGQLLVFYDLKSQGSYGSGYSTYWHTTVERTEGGTVMQSVTDTYSGANYPWKLKGATTTPNIVKGYTDWGFTGDNRVDYGARYVSGPLASNSRIRHGNAQFGTYDQYFQAYPVWSPTSTTRAGFDPNASSDSQGVESWSIYYLPNSSFYSVGEPVGSPAPFKLKYRGLALSSAAVNGGGSLPLYDWEYYTYWPYDPLNPSSFASFGMLQRVSKQFGDLPVSPADNVQDAVVTEYTYAANWDGSYSLPATITTKLRTATPSSDPLLAKSQYDYSASFNGGLPAMANTRSLWVTTAKDYSSDTDFVQTVSKAYRADAPWHFAGKPYSETKPDGTMTVYAYHYLDAPVGTADPVVSASQTTYVASSYFRTMVVHGFSGSGSGGTATTAIDGQTVDQIYLVPNRSTADVTIRDRYGRIYNVQTWIYSSTGWNVMDSVRNYYNIAGEVIRQTKQVLNSSGSLQEAVAYQAQYTDINGTTLSFNGTGSGLSFDNTVGTYTGRKQYDQGADGIIKKYFYDDYGRITKVVELSPPAPAGTVAPAAIATFFTYDAENQICSKQVGPDIVSFNANPLPYDSVGAAYPTSTEHFDLAGRLVSETRPGGYETVTDYLTGANYTDHRITTRIQKDLGGNTALDRSVQKTTYSDGTPKSVSGNGAVPEFHSWTPVSQGSPAKPFVRNVSYVGSDTTGTARSTAVDTDLLGRTVRETSSNPSAVGDLVVNTTYNSAGQLIKKQTGNPTDTDKLGAELYAYDVFGQLFRSAIDLANQGSDSVDLVSADRINEQDTTLVWENGAWWEKTVNLAYADETSGTPYTVRETRKRRSHFPSTTFNPPGGGSAITMQVDGEVRQKDTQGNTTVTYQLSNLAQGLTVSRVVSPFATNVAETVTLNGRMVYNRDMAGAQTFYAYDGYGRLSTSTDRTGTTTMYYPDGFTEVSFVHRPDGTWDQTTYNSFGQIETTKHYLNASASATPPATTDPGEKTTYAYNNRGQVTSISGDAAFPAAYTYYESGDAAGPELIGLLKSIGTYDGTTWAGPQEYQDEDGTYWCCTPMPTPYASTVFTYYPETGLLKEKRSQKGSPATVYKVAYEYNRRRQLAKRTWDRGVITTYAYHDTAGDNTGELKQITYSNGDPTLSYTYNRLGALKTVTDAAGTRTFNYRSADQQMDYQALPSTAYGSGLRVTMTYDGLGQANGFWLGSSLATAWQQTTYGFDPASDRLASVTTPLGTFTYAYLANSSFISRIEAPLSGGLPLVQTRNYHSQFDRLLSQSWSLGGETISAYDFRYDTFHRLSSDAHTGRLVQQQFNPGLAHAYAYNSANNGGSTYLKNGGLMGVSSYLSGSADTLGTTSIPGRNWGYGYDLMGNRLTSTIGKASATDSDTVLSYTPNALGQYDARQRPNFVETSGTIDHNAALSLNLSGQAVTVPGPSVFRLASVAANPANPANPAGSDYFYAKPARASANQTKTKTETVTVGVSLTSPAINSSQNRTTVAPKNAEAFTYDGDGNLLTDAVWNYSYDAENRLAAMWTRADDASFAATPQRLEFVYDYLGRRIIKRVYTGSIGNWTLTGTRYFIHSGWLLVAELNGLGLGTLQKSFFWGPDLSGSLGGAGGIGGLLGVITTTQSPGAYLALSDASGNVEGLLDRATGRLAAEYDYAPFGERLRTAGAMATVNPLQYSTKYMDEETGLVNFGFRYYSPGLGRFLNRDPKDEPGSKLLLTAVSGPAPASWSYIGAFAKDPLNGAVLKQGALLENAQLPHSNERLDQRPKNFAVSGLSEQNKKGYTAAPSIGRIKDGAKSGEETPVGSSGGGAGMRYDHPYAYVNNDPLNAVDPSGLDIFGGYNTKDISFGYNTRDSIQTSRKSENSAPSIGLISREPIYSVKHVESFHEQPQLRAAPDPEPPPHIDQGVWEPGPGGVPRGGLSTMDGGLFEAASLLTPGGFAVGVVERSIAAKVAARSGEILGPAGPGQFVLRAGQGSLEKTGVVRTGAELNRVFDSRWKLGRPYSQPMGGSFASGSTLPTSASRAIIERGLNWPGVVNNAEMGVVYRATQNLSATFRTSLGGTVPEILIAPASRSMLEQSGGFIPIAR